jgi:hypothetical protein
MTVGQTTGFTKREGCLRGYVQRSRFATPGPVVFAQALVDCDGRVLRILNPAPRAYLYLSRGPSTRSSDLRRKHCRYRYRNRW